jgi:hypothetical protein
MKAIILRIVCAASCLLSLLSCDESRMSQENQLEKPRLLAPDDAPSLCCWFVEDDGTGRHGYVGMDAARDYTPPHGGGMFATIEELRDAIRHQKCKTPIIHPQFPASVPQGWRIRDLSKSEVEKLGLSYNNMR